jgi:lipopolysaccharide export system protein LptA
VTADSCVADENANVVQLSGRVEAIQKDLHLWADEAEGIAPPGTKFGMKNPEIVEARGQVVAKTPTQMGYADTAIYKTEEQHLHLQGKEVHLMGGDHRLTAAESADYWENDLKAVARKNVILHTSDKVIKTDELWVFFKRNEEGKLEIIFAYSPIRVSLATPDEIFIGDQGTYDPRSGMATLEGNVSVTRLSDQSRLSGAYATLDLNTGVSHVYAHPPASSKAVVVPIQGKLPEK